jgi:hypothetical protein
VLKGWVRGDVYCCGGYSSYSPIRQGYPRVSWLYILVRVSDAGLGD